MKRKNKCKGWKSYTGEKAPTCGCARCSEKYLQVQEKNGKAKIALSG